MKLADLTDDEQLALVGLLKLVVRADHDLSAQEADELERIAEEMGRPIWTATVQTARERFRTRHDVMCFAESITRREARRLIYSVLVEAALPGTIVPEERRVLDWLAELWQVHDDTTP